MLSVRKGQSVAEYAILLSLVIAAAVAMQVYVRRGLQARMKKGTDAFTGITQDITPGTGAGTATFGALDQYEPYYQESAYSRYQENVEQEHMGGGKIIKEKVSDISAAAAGGYEQQATADNRATRDAKWSVAAAPAP